MNLSPDQFVSVFVTVREVFPELQDDHDTLRSLLKGMDRDSALVVCAQINLELSDPNIHAEERNLTPEQRRMRAQQKLVSFFFTQEEIERLNAYAERRRSTEPIIFFREQVLDLIRWIALVCRDEPHREVGGPDNDELTRRFTKALLIAGSLWSRRVYRDDLLEAHGKSSRAETLETVIRAFRNASTFRLDPITAVSRGRSLLREICAIDPTFEVVFERKTSLNLDDYALAILIILGHTHGRDSMTGLPAPINAGQIKKETTDVQVILTRFLSLVSQTPEALRTALWESKSEPTTDDLAFYDLRPLMEKPILRVPRHETN